MKPLAVLLVFALGACGSSAEKAIQACESFVKMELLSQSSYKRIKATVGDDAVHPDGFKVRPIFLQYDASNAFGTPLRKAEACMFRIDDSGNYLEDLDKVARLSDKAECCIVDRYPTNMSVDEKVANSVREANRAAQEADAVFRGAKEDTK